MLRSKGIRLLNESGTIENWCGIYVAIVMLLMPNKVGNSRYSAQTILFMFATSIKIDLYVVEKFVVSHSHPYIRKSNIPQQQFQTIRR